MTESQSDRNVAAAGAIARAVPKISEKILTESAIIEPEIKKPGSKKDKIAVLGKVRKLISIGENAAKLAQSASEIISYLPSDNPKDSN